MEPATQIGFRIGDALIRQLERIEDVKRCAGEVPSRSVLLREAFSRGLGRLAAGPLRISPEAKEAGSLQVRLQVESGEAELLEGLRARAESADGGHVSRVVVVRQCILQGLHAGAPSHA